MEALAEVPSQLGHQSGRHTAKSAKDRSSRPANLRER
jgi:hypothetical protein